MLGRRREGHSAPAYEVSLQASISKGESHEPDGALDSECNRTLAGQVWLQRDLQLVRDKGLSEYVSIASEREPLKFGNSGHLSSSYRVCVPVIVGGVPLRLWITIFPCDQLGLLVGKDVLSCLGMVLDILLQQDGREGVETSRSSLGRVSSRTPPASSNVREVAPGGIRLCRIGPDGVVGLFEEKGSRSPEAALVFGVRVTGGRGLGWPRSVPVAVSGRRLSPSEQGDMHTSSRAKEWDLRIR